MTLSCRRIVHQYGIQILVTTYDLPDSRPRGGGGGTLESKLKILKVPRNAQISIGGGGYSEVKTENTQSAKKCLNFNFRGGGGALLSEIPERGSLENLDTNLLFEISVQKPACASQIVPHILRMWRLINYDGQNNNSVHFNDRIFCPDKIEQYK